MKHLIKVKGRHIRQGVRHSGRYCPIAVAVSEEPKFRFFLVQVDGRYVRLYKDYKLKFVIGLSDKARAFVRRFDTFKLVKPFSFYLETKD